MEEAFDAKSRTSLFDRGTIMTLLRGIIMGLSLIDTYLACYVDIMAGRVDGR